MGTIVPYLTFRNGGYSLPFLTDALGFRVVRKQLADDGGLIHAELVRGDAVIMGGASETPVAQSPGIYLVVDDVPGIHARALNLGATELSAPHWTEWNTWRSSFVDPDGHEWTIGTYQPGEFRIAVGQ